MGCVFATHCYSSVHIVTRHDAGQPSNRGSILGRGKILFSSPTHPDRILFIGYGELFPRGKAARA
jgi:hypothetical protein